MVLVMFTIFQLKDSEWKLFVIVQREKLQNNNNKELQQFLNQINTYLFYFELFLFLFLVNYVI